MKLQIALTSMVCMIVAMGLGRFALTPQMPHMIAEGQNHFEPKDHYSRPLIF